MVRPSREEIQRRENAQSKVITVKPSTVVEGGFPFAALLPFALAAAAPALGKAGSWVGNKIFGNGVRQAGRGVLRSGDKMSMQPPIVRGSGLAGKLVQYHPPAPRAPTIRAGDMPMPRMVPIPAYRTSNSSVHHMSGGAFNPLQALINPMSMLTGNGKKTKSKSGMAAKMAKLRAMKGKGKKKA